MLDSLESQVFSRIKYGFSDRIKQKYKELNFTTTDKSATQPKFPCVYVHLIPSNSIGDTLEGGSIEGVGSAFQVDVQDNQSQARAGEVADEVLRIMVSIGFKPRPMPYFDNPGSTYRSTARYFRAIGDNDIL